MEQRFLGREDGDRWKVFTKSKPDEPGGLVDEIEATVLEGTKEPYEVVLKGFSPEGFFRVYSSNLYHFQLIRKPKEEKPNLHNLKGGGFPN